MRLKDKVSVITGGARGIGFGIAEKMASEGADVAIVDVVDDVAEQSAESIRGMGRRSRSYHCNVSDSGEVQAMVQAVAKDFGSFDVLVNVAGVNSHVAIIDMEEEEWDRIIGTNLKGTFLCTREASRYWVGSGRGGKVINITSNRAELGRPNLAHYCASKGGVKMFTRSAALELVKHGIIVNAIGPGPVGGTGLSAGRTVSAPSADTLPMGKMGTPEDIGWAAVYLASDEAQYLLGTTLYVDGGHSIGHTH